MVPFLEKPTWSSFMCNPKNVREFAAQKTTTLGKGGRKLVGKCSCLAFTWTIRRCVPYGAGVAERDRVPASHRLDQPNIISLSTSLSPASGEYFLSVLLARCCLGLCLGVGKWWAGQELVSKVVLKSRASAQSSGTESLPSRTAARTPLLVVGGGWWELLTSQLLSAQCNGLGRRVGEDEVFS